MRNKEPEMLQPDAFCEHTMQQNATAAYSVPQDPVAGFKGSASRRSGDGRRKGEKEEENKKNGERGREGRRDRRELEQKAGPDWVMTADGCVHTADATEHDSAA